MFKLEEFMGKRVLKSSLISDENVVAFFTTRDLPLKSGEREDLIDEVENNKKLVCQGLGIAFENLVIPIQTHSDNVGIVEGKGKREKGKAKRHCEERNDEATQKIPSQFLTFSLFKNTDALITNQSNIALALNFADCVPIILYDPVQKVAAAVHAGWKGTVKKIAVKTVKKMQKEFSSKPKDIIALIGPAIGKCCFELGDDVLEKLLKTVKNSEKAIVHDKMHVDLKLINKFQLLANGVEKIDLCADCTCCQNELFFSYRKEKGKTARHSAVVMFK